MLSLAIWLIPNVLREGTRPIVDVVFEASRGFDGAKSLRELDEGSKGVLPAAAILEGLSEDPYLPGLIKGQGRCLPEWWRLIDWGALLGWRPLCKFSHPGLGNGVGKESEALLLYGFVPRLMPVASSGRMVDNVLVTQVHFEASHEWSHVDQLLHRLLFLRSTLGVEV